MSFSPLATLYAMGFSHALFFAVILLKKNNSNTANKILAILLIVLAYKLFEGTLLHSGLYKDFPHLLDWLPPEALLIGPLCFAYVRSLSGKKPWSTPQWLVHLIPALALVALNFPNLLLSADMKIAMWDAIVFSEAPRVLSPKVILLLLAIKVHLATYLFFAWQLLGKLEKQVEDNLSNNSVYLIHWQKQICIVFIALEALWVILFMLQNLNIVSPLLVLGNYWLLFVSVVIFLLSYWGLQNIDLISGITPLEKLQIAKNSGDIISLVVPDNSHQRRYKNSPLSEDSAEEIVKLIQDVLLNKQLYLQPGLKLVELAEAVGTKHHLVSQVINETMNTRFNSLINKYRAEYAKSLLDVQGSHFSIEQIAIESGFSNRVTFNKIFKATYNMSPSIYKSGLLKFKADSSLQQ